MFVDMVKISLMGGFLFMCAVSASHATDVPATRDALLRANTAPIAQVDVAGASTAPVAAAAMSGEQRYKTTCSLCHDSGAAGAPKVGNKAVWAPRLAQGEDALVTAAIKGIGAMPAKGGCASCSDAEIRATVEYMIGKSK